MALAALPNQRSVESVGVWMWRQCTLSTVTTTVDVIFALEGGVILLDYLISMITAGTATTSMTGTPRIDNATPVAVGAAHDLTSAAGTDFVLDKTTATMTGVVTEDGGANFSILITSTLPLTAAEVRVGINVARLDYDVT